MDLLNVQLANQLREALIEVERELSILDTAVEVETRVNRGTLLRLTFSENEKAFEEIVKIMRTVLFVEQLSIRSNLEALGVKVPPLEPQDARRTA